LRAPVDDIEGLQRRRPFRRNRRRDDLSPGSQELSTAVTSSAPDIPHPGSNCSPRTPSLLNADCRRAGAAGQDGDRECADGGGHEVVRSAGILCSQSRLAGTLPRPA
jgi:hypothetical protein